MIRRKIVLVALLGIMSLILFVEVAAAYVRVYYLGTESNPVAFTGGIYRGTPGRAFRLFNEATALRSANPLFLVDLYYSNTKIGSCTATYYCNVYRNGPNSTASCSLATQSAYHQARAYCDTGTG